MEQALVNIIYLQKERMNKVMVQNCVRLSNDSKFFISSDEVNINNTYTEILNGSMNIGNSIGHSISKTMESVVMFIYNSRSGLLSMEPDVIKSLKRLRDIENLPPDWNGYGAKSFSSALIDKCERIVNSLSVQPLIYPTGRNSIQFQYELSDRSYLEFEIFESKIMCLQVPKRIYSEAIELELTDSEDDRIKEIVDIFYGRNSTEK